MSFRTCVSLQHYGTSFKFGEPPVKRFDENASLNLNYAVLENKTVLYHFVHVYKIRYSDNTSLVTNFLGSWYLDSWSLNNPISVKLRNEFKGQPIIFGVLNGTIDGQMDVNEEETNDIAPFLDFAKFVASSVNARYQNKIIYELTKRFAMATSMQIFFGSLNLYMNSRRGISYRVVMDPIKNSIWEFNGRYVFVVIDRF